MDGNTQPNGQPTDPSELRAGDTVTPQPAASPTPPQPAPEAAISPTAPTAAGPEQPLGAFDPNVPDDFTPSFGDNPGHVSEVSWTASEFIAHHKAASWYLGLALVTIVIAGLVALLTKDRLSAILVVLAGAVFGVYANRKPRQLQYRVDDSGLTIGVKHYPYAMFRSFAVDDTQAFSSIVFMPLKRFGASLSIYYDPSDEDRIVAVLSDRLPIENHKPDVIEALMRRIRF